MREIGKIQYITQALGKTSILEEVNTVLEAGIDWVQLRIKEETEDLEETAVEVKRKCEGKATFILNDRVELAQKIGADGVHLGKKDMPITEARKLFGEHKIIGGTANTIADCKNLEIAGADYIGMGPYAFTETKKELSPILGLEGFKNLFPKEDDYGWMILSINTPVVAIGGIQLADVDLLANETSVHGVALSGLIYQAENKRELVEQLKNKLYGSVENRG